MVLSEVVTRHYGSQGMVGRLRRVLVRPPDAAFGDADPRDWHYTSRPDLPAARQEHEAFVALLADSGAEVVVHQEPCTSADALFTHDPSLVTDRGAILLRMGKSPRRDEPACTSEVFRRLGIPILAVLEGEARAEGGDLLWIDHRTLAAGQGYRTNAEGLRQLTDALAPLGVTTLPVPLPEHGGPDACLHLMSLISLVDVDCAVVYLPLLPAEIREPLLRRRFRFVEVPDEEFATMGPNVLAVAPGDCVMLDNNPVTRQRLEHAGCRVRAYVGDEISLKAEGGATCLTRPILREPSD